ncbi:forkhead box protein E3 [Ischnura elegans]|uniref:forkhead box protein E3 n=1 Tax=Ischnura elegans TaxID=197161 RepID=UPI001ED8A282|nr:forkhead box protein E3 [Ischnura elegans]
MCSNAGGPGAISASFTFGDQPPPPPPAPADASSRTQPAPGPAAPPPPDVEPDGLAPSFPSAALGTPLDHYRLQLYHYAMAERLRYAHPALFSGPQHPHHPYAASVAPGFQALRPHDFPLAAAYQYGKLDPRLFRVAEEPKPQHSYIGLIAMAILNSSDRKLVLSDIYQYILDNYPYFRSRGPGWRNSIRHNLSLNDCFVKAGRSANGKGHYWAIHPANVEDFRKGDFRRRKAQRKVRKHMGLAVDEEDSPSPPPVSPPGWAGNPVAPLPPRQPTSTSLPPRPLARKRQFDVASLLAPDDPTRPEHFHHHHHLHHPQVPPVGPPLPGAPCCSDDEDAIDVVSGDERREPCLLPPPPWVRLPPPPTQVPTMLFQPPHASAAAGPPPPPPIHRPAPLTTSSTAAAEHLGRMYLQSLAQRRSREAAAVMSTPERDHPGNPSSPKD